jgi:pantoate--beta-alanine ligase
MTSLDAIHRSVSRPRVVSSMADLNDALAAARADHRRIGLVPTMGALHEGHLSLVRAAAAECDIRVATIFVNPTQFGPQEDFTRYPRTLSADLELLAVERVHVVFAPTENDMYPPGSSTAVEPPAEATPFEGRCRPGHFRGVSTIVLKLLNLVRPQVAYFGQKDYQQSLVIRRMVEDLNVPAQIRVCPTVREADGLAMSSRNKYLNASERQRAVAISRSLAEGKSRIELGERSAAVVRDRMLAVLANAGITRIDYVAVADSETLVELDTISSAVVLLIAAFVGETRLIDNMLVR